ncbi:defective proboscis extension response 17 [Haematobia irritans]|uniref:defective proboscis extension response 17 n=1 Tax=Haematobia irritans TaxID=7368 RepID=UPI003F50D37D
MNFYRSLRKNPNASSTPIKTKGTIATEGYEDVASTSVLGVTTITSGTNVKTTTTTTTLAATASATRPRPPPVSATPTSTSRALANTQDTIYRNFISTSHPAHTSAIPVASTITIPYQSSSCSSSCCCPTTNAICCCSTSYYALMLSSKSKKNSRRFCDTTSVTDIRRQPTKEMEGDVMPPSPPPPTTLLVPPPLFHTSMSAQQQISLTSRVNAMVDNGGMPNEETITSTRASVKASSDETSTTSQTSRRRPTSHSTLPSQSPSKLRRSYSSGGSRNLYRNIKMPLRRLMLTIMAAVLLSTEFTICGTTTTMLGEKLKVISLVNDNSSHIPVEPSSASASATTVVTTNKSSKINDSLPSSPVTLTTLTTIQPSLEPSTPPLSMSSSSMATSLLSASIPSSPSAATTTKLYPPSIETTSIERKSSLKSLETASLTEALPSLSTSSQTSQVTPMAEAAVETAAETLPFLSSPSLSSSSMSYLTATTQNEPLTVDDFNASSELLSVPTSILNTYDASDLPPLTEAEQAAKDLLTKGFSIPTYLPPFPVFAVADLPAYLNTVSTTTTEAPSNHHMSPDDEMSSLENLLYFDNAGGSGGNGQDPQQRRYHHRKLQTPRRNSSLAGANNVTVQEGNHAYLPCRIHRLQNKPVSWVRLRDGHIISVDQTTFIADQRFQAIFQDDKEYTWSLQIKYVQQTDEGWFECQASSEPKMSAKVYLKVIVPLTELIGDQSRFVKAGSKVALHCIVRGTLDPPQYIIWYRDKTQISEDNKMGWYTQLDRNIFGNNGDNENTIGSLIIPSVRKMDSGNYTCQPSNSASVSVDLHVLSGEYSASAIMSAARTYALNDAYLLILLLLMLLHNT